jgi:hypothetical protein
VNSQEYLEWRLGLRPGVREQKTREAPLTPLPESVLRELRYLGKLERDVRAFEESLQEMITENQTEKQGNDATMAETPR